MARTLSPRCWSHSTVLLPVANLVRESAINPKPLTHNLQATLRNNIIASASMAGVNVWAARDTVIAHNTFWQDQEMGQSTITVAQYIHDDAPQGPLATSSSALALWGNVLVRSPTARPGPIVQIRENGLDPNSPLVMSYNVYYDMAGAVVLEDERAGLGFAGNVQSWAAHCTGDLRNAQCTGSVEGDPRLDGSFAPLACSSNVRGRVPSTVSTSTSFGSFTPGAVLASNDFHGRTRTGSQYDTGAVQSGASGATKAMPPVPPAVAGKPVFTGAGLPPVYDKTWPFYW